MLVSILISVGFLLACGLVLAGLLVLAEKKILNYGTCHLDVNAGRKVLDVEGGSSLLSSLAEKNIFIPSACGGRGSCAYCKLKVMEGGGMIGPVEEPYLTPEERKQNVRLSCQVKVRKDLRVEIPEELFSVSRFRAKLVHKKPLTHDIVELRMQLLEPASISFEAGQYVQLESADYKGHEIQPGDAVQSDDQIDAFIREHAESAFHPCGTCRIGRADDPMAVVDPDLRVIGVEGLRIADSSIFPRITNGNLNAPSIMTGEKAADHVLGQGLLPALNLGPELSPAWAESQR